jgi:hypothetical protein
MDLMNPCGIFEIKGVPLTKRSPLTEDTVVGLFANDKKNADVLLSHVQKLLEQHCKIKKFVWFNKEATVPAEFTEEFIADCDVVAAAISD